MGRKCQHQLEPKDLFSMRFRKMNIIGQFDFSPVKGPNKYLNDV